MMKHDRQSTMLPPISIEDIISEIDRELTKRHRVYPRQIARGTLKDEVARKRIRVLAEVLKHYRDKQKEGPLFRA
jgi:hypothetical protein